MNNKWISKFVLVVFVFITVLLPDAFGAMNTFGGMDTIDRIEVQVVYYLPKDSTPLPDWKERINYHIQRAEKFHQREFQDQSKLKIFMMDEPFVSSKTQAEMPDDNPNTFFWMILNEVSASNKVQFNMYGFSILLVMSDHNFSPSYDDWNRTCDGKGCLFDAPHEDCKGHVRGDGDHRPGSRCGGSRAVYWAQKHQGFGLVTADGWRVPIKGTDCVFYHEGIGHTVGLPHPEPNDDSVMGTAQYADAIHAAWVNESQKEAMGFEKAEINRDDLFSTFTIGHEPLAPEANEDIMFYAKLPKRFDVNSIVLEIQTDLWEPFQPVNSFRQSIDGNEHLFRWNYSGLESGKSLAYRIRVELNDGSEEMIWHFVNVK